MNNDQLGYRRTVRSFVTASSLLEDRCFSDRRTQCVLLPRRVMWGSI